jgi:hypothetical protein
MAKHDSNTIIKFADNTTVVGLMTRNDETAFREEIRELAVWWQNNNRPTLTSTGRKWSRSRVSSYLVSTSPTNYHGPNTPRQL